MKKKSTYGLSPEQLERLLSIGSKGQTSDTPQSRHLARPQIEGYEILDKLGEAGQGQVWLALQLSTNRQVALKVPKTGLISSDKALARFEREVELAASLKHPNIAQIHDSGIQHGIYYYTMDLIEGLQLDEYVKQHNLSSRRVLELMVTICLAVQHAHQKGVIHRDLKPSNIIVTDAGLPYIVDFGLARNLLKDDLAVSIDGEAAGTPAYMSPEQAAGHIDKLDTRTDVYSLGVILFMLLTGESPHDLSGSRIEVMRRIADEQVRRPRKISHEIDKDLELLLLKALDNEPDRRYMTAGEMARDIENYLQGAPLIAGPPGMLYRLKKFVRRHKALVAGVTAVLVVMIAGIVVSTIFAIKARRQANISQAVSDFLRNDLIASAEPGKAKGRDTTMISFLEIASENLDGKFENEPLVEASIRETLGWTYRMLGDLKMAEPHLERALKLRQEHLGAEHPDTLRSMALLSWVYSGQGRYWEVERLRAKTFEIRRRVLGDEHPKTLVSMKELAFTYLHLGCYEKAEQMYLEVILISRRVLGEQGVMGIGHLSRLYLRQGRYDEAEAMCLKQQEIGSRELDDEHQYTLAYMRHLANIYRQQGRYDESEAQYLKTLGIERRVLGEKHSYTLGCMNGLARLYTEQGRYDEAGPLFEHALENIHDMAGEYPPSLYLKHGLALLRTKQKRYDEAEILFNETLEVRRRRLGGDHPDTLGTKNDLAVLYKEQARYDEAEPLLLEAAEGRIEKLGLQHPHTQKSIRELIELYEVLDRSDEAKIWWAKLPE